VVKNANDEYSDRELEDMKVMVGEEVGGGSEGGEDGVSSSGGGGGTMRKESDEGETKSKKSIDS
jgi:hypothetical protein